MQQGMKQHPKFKLNFFTDQLQNERARQYVLLEGLVSDYNTSSDESARSSSPVQSKRQRTDEPGQSIHTSFWECYDEVVAEKFTDDHNGTASTSKNTIAGDPDKYLNMKILKRTDNPFAWWATHKSKFSKCIVKLAAKYLSASASSVYSKRLFSEAGDVYEEKRNRLLPKDAEKLIFCTITHHLLTLATISNSVQ
ncbi:hypothetical protein ILUMI_13595 [Ignelater luminosus]|uniref:HAT C-terminal dimerisation domain-containing protein n=1 Tax=Ignelater luminosus TaxID=2038154 RepID=A0A8K0CXI1_IGNLU|nr:hypothetical protein ILUMI_13595 [Ignelater luminosus]